MHTNRTVCTSSRARFGFRGSLLRVPRFLQDLLQTRRQLVSRDGEVERSETEAGAPRAPSSGARHSKKGGSPSRATAKSSAERLKLERHARGQSRARLSS